MLNAMASVQFSCSVCSCSIKYPLFFCTSPGTSHLKMFLSYFLCLNFIYCSVQLLSRVQLFATPWIPARHTSLSITNSVHSNSCPSSQWCHPAISSSVVPFSSCSKSLPASGSFPVSQLFASSGQSTGVSAFASVLPKNTQDWSPSEWTGWNSLQSKGLSRVFSNTTVQKHQFFGTQLSSQSNSPIHTWPLEEPQPWLEEPLLAKYSAFQYAV